MACRDHRPSVDRFLDLSNGDDVVNRVLHEWLLRELRDDLASRLTWRHPELQRFVGGLRLRVDASKPVEVYFLSPIGIGGKFFYEHPVGEAFYSAEAHVVVDYEAEAVRLRLAEDRLFWVGSGEGRGYRISEGFDDLFESIIEALTNSVAAPRPGAPGTRRGSRSLPVA